MRFQRTFAAGLTAVVVMMASESPRAADDMDYARFTISTVETYIRPAAKELVSTFAKLEQETGKLCTAPTAANKATFNSAFTGAVVSLASLDFFRFGPLAYNNISHRLAFLPDSRGVVRRQVNKIIAAKDASVTNPASLSIKSAALQGLTALERIAYAPNGTLTLGQDENAVFLCDFAESITINLAGTALEVEANWADPNGFSKTLLTPSMNGSIVQTHKEAAELIYNALKTGLELDKDQYLMVVLGRTAKKARPAKAPFARSGNAIAYLSASLSGIEKAIQAGGYMQVLDSHQKWVANTLNFEFANAQKVLASLPHPLRKSGKQPEVRNRLQYLNLILGGLRDVLSADLAGYLELSGGFNALDGD